MPRRKAAVLEDQPLTGLEDLDQDPQPRPARGRPRKTTGATATKRIPARTATGRIASKASMQAKVREEAFTYLSLMAAGWEIRDPWCAAQATEERIGVVADQFVAMVSRSDSLLQSVASSGIIGNVIMMMNALFPIVREVWRAHGPGGHGHQDQGGDEGDVTARYPAYAAS